MSSKAIANPRQNQAQLWQRGFLAVFRRELQSWIPRRLLISLVIWLLLAVVMPFGFATILAANQTAASGAGQRSAQTLISLGFFFTVLTSLPMFGAIFSMRGTISDERKTGTLPWVLSKPVFRSSFYLAKLKANLFLRVGVVVLLQGTLAAIIVALQGGLTQPLNFVGALAIVALLLLFYISFTLLLDTIFAKGILAIVLPVVVLMGGSIIPPLVSMLTQRRDIAELMMQTTPWGIDSSSLTRFAIGEAPLNSTPILCTFLWAVVFTVIGIGYFNRQEV